MILVIPEYDLLLQSREDQVMVLVIENRVAVRHLLSDLWGQGNCGEGDTKIVINENTVDLVKAAEVIINPWAIDPNNRKMLSQLYKDLQETAEAEMQEATAEIRARMVNYIDCLLGTSEHRLDSRESVDISELLKLYGVEFEEETDLVERICTFVQLSCRILKTKVFIFFNLKQLLNKEELLGVYEAARYEKAELLLIESVQTEKLSGERGWILDPDLCIIDLD